jgi:hypothetical protein
MQAGMMQSAPGNDFIRHNVPSYTSGEISVRRDAGLSQSSNHIRLGLPSTHSERDVDYQRDELMGTNLVNKVRVMPTMAQRLHPEIDMLKKIYAFREPDQVTQFLSGNKTLTGMISSIYAKIRREFPTGDIILEAVSDSPFSNEKDIVISVSTSLPVDDAIEHLDKVEDVRWDKDSIDPYVDICVKLEYQ